MPRRALTTCPCQGSCGQHAGACPELVQSGRCPHCTRAADRARGSGGQRGYTAKWARFRRRYLDRHPVCECDGDCCPPDGCHRRATDIDHIDGTGRTGPRAYDESNLQALCHRCHSRKTSRLDGAFGR
jgi:5-methylcytosine-specific restriction protein A